MAQEEIKSNHFTDDIIDFLLYLNKYKVRYVIVGGQAVVYYGHSRLTGDIDFYYDRSKTNCEKLFRALSEFWEGDIPGVKYASELMEKKMVFQFGVPPNRIDLINELDGLEFDGVWKEHVKVNLIMPDEKVEINFIGLNSLIKNKEKTARPRDLEDLNFLKSIKEK